MTTELTLFAIVDQQFNDVVEHEVCIEPYRRELRAEFASRRRDWGEGFRLYEIPNCFSRGATTVIPRSCKLMRTASLPPFLERE
jgi:hypothetical protein